MLPHKTKLLNLVHGFLRKGQKMIFDPFPARVIGSSLTRLSEFGQMITIHGMVSTFTDETGTFTDKPILSEQFSPRQPRPPRKLLIPSGAPVILARWCAPRTMSAKFNPIKTERSATHSVGGRRWILTRVSVIGVVYKNVISNDKLTSAILRRSENSWDRNSLR